MVSRRFLLAALTLAAPTLPACGTSTGSTSSDASTPGADGEVTLATPPGYVVVEVPNPDGPCALPAACGGDITGRWVLVKECNRFPDNNWPTSDTCDLTNVGVQATVWESKTLTFSGGIASAVNERLEGFVFDIPATCLASTPCSQWGANIQQSIDAYAVMASCATGAAGACTCTEVAPDPTFSGTTTGTYAVDDAGASLTSSSGTSNVAYCVSGNTLTYFNTDGDWVYTYQKL